MTLRRAKPLLAALKYVTENSANTPAAGGMPHGLRTRFYACEMATACADRFRPYDDATTIGWSKDCHIFERKTSPYLSFMNDLDHIN